MAFGSAANGADSLPGSAEHSSVVVQPGQTLTVEAPETPVWIQGDAEVRLPVAEPMRSPALFFAHGRAGSLAEEIPCTLKEGLLRFTAKSGWGLRKLFLLPA